MATTFESCRRIGYDIEAWVRDGLCDIVIAGGNSGTDPGAEVERFVELCKPAGVCFYGGFDTDGRQQARRLRPHRAWRVDWFRGLAHDCLDRGADGVYVFNWHGHRDTQRPLLTTMGSRQTLRGQDKVYTSLHRSVSRTGTRVDADRDDRIYGKLPVDLHRTLTDAGPTFHVTVSDDVTAGGVDLKGAELQIEIAHLSTRHEVKVALDGIPLGPAHRRDAAAEDPEDPADVSENSWLTWPLEKSRVKRGVHQVSVQLVERDPRLAVPLRIEQVEISLKYHR